MKHQKAFHVHAANISGKIRKLKLSRIHRLIFFGHLATSLLQTGEDAKVTKTGEKVEKNKNAKNGKKSMKNL